MTETPAGQPDDKDEIDLAYVVLALRKRWLIVLGCMIAAGIICSIQLRSAPPVYQVGMMVAAVERSAYDARRAKPNIPHEARQAGPLQTSPAAMGFTLYLESLRTRDVADELAKNPEVLQILFPGEWDGARKALRQSPGALPGLAGRLGSLFGWPAPAPPPPGARVQRFLLENILIEQDQQKHAFATIRMQSTQPQRAARFLALLHQAADDRMRQNGLLHARSKIAALEALPDARTDAVAIQALGEERVMEAAALSGTPFAAQLLDEPAALPDPISSPLRSLVSALVLGLAAGVALVLSLHWCGAFLARRSEAHARRGDAEGSGNAAP